MDFGGPMVFLEKEFCGSQRGILWVCFDSDNNMESKLEKPVAGLGKKFNG